MNITIITSGSKARSTPACVITRGMTQAITATLLTEGGANVSTAGVAAWELGITDDFLRSTPLLAAASTITAAETVLSVEWDGDTVEMSEYLDGKKTAPGFATLKGYDGAGDTVAAYVWQVVLQNVGYDADTEAAHAIDGLFHTAAQVDAKFAAVGNAIPAATESSRGTIALATAGEAAAGTDQSKAITPATLGAALEDAIPVIPPIPADLSDLSDTTGILTGKEPVANKTQAIDAEDPSADKYTSEAAVVAYVAGAVTDAMGDIEAVLDELIGGAP
jgi:hypothetical protein